jgi:8-oxo-dGTP pyrophosphatase MutT (NUDIX family)
VRVPTQLDNRDWQYSQDLRDRISLNLANFNRERQHASGKRHASVALVLTNMGTAPLVYGMPQVDATETGMILTRRSKNLVNHAGQWALPGGSVDPGETAEQTALRELEEEVNLRLEEDAIIGKLDDFTTRSGYIITPVVIWGGENLRLQANPDEVSAIHRIPLAEFMRKDAPLFESIPESDEPVLLMPVGTGWIATPTGAILYQFREVALQGRNIRVSHYEQPYFAWQ